MNQNASFPSEFANWSAIVRRRAVYGIVFITLGWITYGCASFSRSFEILVLGFLILSAGVFLDLFSDSIFHPLSVFLLFVWFFTLCDATFLIFRNEGEAFFFSYTFLVGRVHVFVLIRECMIIFSISYFAYLFIEGSRKRRFKSAKEIWVGTIDRLWFVAYSVGIAIMVFLIRAHGGLSAFETVGGYRTQIVSGEGIYVFLQNFIFVGIFLLYKKIIYKPILIKYGLVVVLSAPLVISGSRNGLVIAVFGIGYLDYVYGRRTKIVSLFAILGAVLVLITLLGVMRSRYGNEIAVAVIKDLSMGNGFILAYIHDFFSNQGSLLCYFLPFKNVIPGFIRSEGWWPRAPNDVFTEFFFPMSDFTASFGIMGEAAYIFGWNFRWINYFVLGSFFCLSNRFSKRYSPLIGAAVAGSAMRYGKGGIVGGGSQLFQLLFVLVFTLVTYRALSSAVSSGRTEPSDAR